MLVFLVVIITGEIPLRWCLGAAHTSSRGEFQDVQVSAGP